MDMRQRIRLAVEAAVNDEGVQLVAVELTGNTHGNIVRLFIDRPGGVTIEECARVSRAVSPTLDVVNPFSAGYRLEVSSPGMERPVETAADFERFTGFRAKIRTVPGSTRRRYSGTLGGIDGEHILITVDGEDHHIPLAELDWAHLVLDLEEFNRLKSAPVADTDPNPVPQGGQP
jgi:ribosome maturation factor RimP